MTRKKGSSDMQGFIEHGPSNIGHSFIDLSEVVAWWAHDNDDITLEYEDGSEKKITCNHNIFRRLFDLHLASRKGNGNVD